MEESVDRLRGQLLQELTTKIENPETSFPDDADISSDITVIYRLYEMQKLVRFFGQRYWEQETLDDCTMPGHLHLETVAAHTFQVANTSKLLAPHFPWLNQARTIELALVHDQPEIFIGDKDPVGHDGKGLQTHAFNAQKRDEKESEERVALDALVNDMRHSMKAPYRSLVEEYISNTTNETRFVKSIDKLQALIFVRLKKAGRLTPDHTAFTIRYSHLGVLQFPLLQKHFLRVMHDILDDIRYIQPEKFPLFCQETIQSLKNFGGSEKT